MADSSQDSDMDKALPGGQVEPSGMLQSVSITARDLADVPSSNVEVNKEPEAQNEAPSQSCLSIEMEENRPDKNITTSSCASTQQENPLVVPSHLSPEAQNEVPSQSLQSYLSTEMEENRPDNNITTSCATTQQENPLVVPDHQEVSATSSIASAVDSVNSSHDTVEISPCKVESRPDAESGVSTKEIPSIHEEQGRDVDSSTRRDSKAQDETPSTQEPLDLKTGTEEPMEVSHVDSSADATPALEAFQETSEMMDTTEPACQQEGDDGNEYADGTMSSKFPVETNQSMDNQSEEFESCEKSIAQVPVDEAPKQQTQHITTDTQVCFLDSQSEGEGLVMAEKSSADVESTSDANNQRSRMTFGNESGGVLSLETEMGKDSLSVKPPPDDSERYGTPVASGEEGTDSEVQNAVTTKNDPVNETVQEGTATVRPLIEETLLDNPSWSENKDAPTSSVASFLEPTEKEHPQVTTPSEETAMHIDEPSVATVKEDAGIEDPTMDEEDALLGSENEDAGVDGPSVAPLDEDAEMDGSGVASLNELAVMGDQSVEPLSEDTKNVGTTVTSVDDDEAIVDEDEAIVGDLSAVSRKEDALSLMEDAETESPQECATNDYPNVPPLSEVTGTDGSDAASLNEETGRDSPSAASLKEDSASLREDDETDGPHECAAKDCPSVPPLNEVTGTDGSTPVSLNEETGRDSPSAVSLKEVAGGDSPNVASTKGDTGRDSPSVASGRSSPSQKTRRRPMSRDSVLTEAYEQMFILGVFPAENLFEYQWPLEKGSEWYFVQEQVCEFMQIKSFKRKYPDLERRVMDSKEKDFLRERGVVTEEQVTLGLTALRSDEVYDLMLRDAPDKSAEYARVLHEKEKQNISNEHKQYEPPTVDSSKVQEYIKKAVRQAADYNSALMAERKEERQYYFDMQTLTVQMPASKMKKRSKEATKLGPYPVAVIPGQYQNYYNSYTSDELKYFPLSTSLYGPMAPRRQSDLAPPQTDVEVFSDNETVLSIEALEYSSESEDGMAAPIPMEVNQSNLELQTEVSEAAASITLASEPPVYKPKDIPDAICGLCLKDSSENKMGMHEKMIHCSQCDNSGHPSCLDMTESMVDVIQTYPWQCMECKTCFHCGDPTHEDKMMFCDMCDRGYHTFCVGLQDIPTGLWACESCQTTDDTPAALEPHVPSPPPSAPTPSPEESAPEDRSSTPVIEASPASKKRGRKSGTPGAGNTPGGKKKRASTPTPKRVKKK